MGGFSARARLFFFFFPFFHLHKQNVSCRPLPLVSSKRWMLLSWVLLVPSSWGVKELLCSRCWRGRAVPCQDLGRITQRSWCAMCWGGAMASDEQDWTKKGNNHPIYNLYSRKKGRVLHTPVFSDPFMCNIFLRSCCFLGSWSSEGRNLPPIFDTWVRQEELYPDPVNTAKPAVENKLSASNYCGTRAALLFCFVWCSDLSLLRGKFVSVQGPNQRNTYSVFQKVG